MSGGEEMSKRHQIREEEVLKIQEVRRKNKDKTIDRWLEVLLLHGEGKTREEISAKTGFGKQYITELVSEYVREGLEHFSTKQYKVNRRNLSIDEEKALLEPFKTKAKAGQIVEVGEIKLAYEQAAGRKTKSHGQIYRVLARHGWRKIMPRSKHPSKADDEAIEASKKLTIGWTNCELSTGKI